jgi:hypothetical protein
LYDTANLWIVHTSRLRYNNEEIIFQYGDSKMKGITTKEAAEKWGITLRQVQLLCAKGRIPGTVRFGNAWVIPADAEKPKDGRQERKHRK